jgi:hypothetical protein
MSLDFHAARGAGSDPGPAAVPAAARQPARRHPAMPLMHGPAAVGLPAGGHGTGIRGTPAPTILDVEASGFGRRSYPIEIGFVLPDGNSGCTLVRPEPTWTHWDPDAQRVHGIARRTVERSGRPAREVAGWLNDHLRGQTVYCDGWAHDYAWLGLLFDAAGLRPAFRLEHLRRLMSDDQAARWHAVLAAVRGESQLARHRASADARVLQAALLRLAPAD